MSEKTEAQEVVEQVYAATILTADNYSGSFIGLPDGYSVHDLEAFQGTPSRVKANHKFRDTKSLAAYLDRFQMAQTIAFSKNNDRQIAVVIDHHAQCDSQHDSVPSHCDHKATFCAQFTPQYEAWRKIDGKGMTQISAGLFLEERSVDVAEPDAATIMDMVMQFDALKKVTFRQSSRLHDGQRQFTYSEENEVRGNVTLPERITILVGVFEGQEPERVLIRVRYRIEDGSLRFQFDIHDRQAVENTAFERCEDALATQVKNDLLILHSV